MLFPDHFDAGAAGRQPARVERTLRELQPGVTEVHVQPAIDTPEVRALSPNWEAWVDDHRARRARREARRRDRRSPGVHLIGFRQLRAAEREG